MSESRGRPPKKPDFVNFSIRLGGDQKKIYNDLKAIETRTGKSFADVVRAVLQIGIASFENGSNVGFDGRVILGSEKLTPKTTDAIQKEEVESPAKNMASKFLS